MTSKKKSPTADLVKLVEYMEDDEAKHFDQMTLNGEDTSDHIYHSVRAVRDWLNANGVQTRPAWWRLSADAAESARERASAWSTPAATDESDTCVSQPPAG
jgi:hypothetical protein